MPSGSWTSLRCLMFGVISSYKADLNTYAYKRYMTYTPLYPFNDGSCIKMFEYGQSTYNEIQSWRNLIIFPGLTSLTQGSTGPSLNRQTRLEENAYKWPWWLSHSSQIYLDEIWGDISYHGVLCLESTWTWDDLTVICLHGAPVAGISNEPSYLVPVIPEIDGGAEGSLQVPLPMWQDPTHRLLGWL